MISDCDNALPGEIRQTQPGKYGRNEFGEHKTTKRQWPISEYKQKYNPKPPRMGGATTKSRREVDIYADDLKSKTADLDETYAKLTACGEVGAKSHIEINRGKVVILVQKKVKLPESYKNGHPVNTKESRYKRAAISPSEK